MWFSAQICCCKVRLFPCKNLLCLNKLRVIPFQKKHLCQFQKLKGWLDFFWSREFCCYFSMETVTITFTLRCCACMPNWTVIVVHLLQGMLRWCNGVSWRGGRQAGMIGFITLQSKVHNPRCHHMPAMPCGITVTVTVTVTGHLFDDISLSMQREKCWVWSTLHTYNVFCAK